MRTVTIKTCEGLKTLEWHDEALILPQDRHDVLVEKILFPEPIPENLLRMVQEMNDAAMRLAGLAHTE